MAEQAKVESLTEFETQNDSEVIPRHNDIDGSRHSMALSFVSDLEIFSSGPRWQTREEHSSDFSRNSIYSKVSKPDRGLTPFSACCVVVNYISAGYILLPGAFSRAGVLYSPIVLGLVALQSYVTAGFLLEACARAESLTVHDEMGGRLPRRFSIKVRERKFELSLLSQIFLGRRWSSFLSLLTACDLYGITWTFCSIFAATFEEKLPLGVSASSYKIYVAVFVAITLPLSCTSILDQFIVQLVFLATRLVMFIAMVSSLIIALVDPDSNLFGDNNGPSGEDLALFDFKETVLVIQTCVFATAFQFSVPAIASVSKKDSGVKKIFGCGVSFIYITNVVLAVLAAVYFGRDLNESSNLEWANFQANSPALTRFVSGFVTLFAAIDGLAVYPLICISLGDNLLHTVYGIGAHEAEKNWKIRSLFRLLAALPQAIGSLFVRDLGVLAKYAGIFTLLSYTAAPSAIYIASGRTMAEKQLTKATSYSHRFLSSDLIAYGLLVIVAAIIVGIAIEAILGKRR